MERTIHTRSFSKEHALNEPCAHLQQLALVRVGWLDVSLGQLINLPPQVSVLLPDSVQLGLSLGTRAARLKPQPTDEGLFCPLGCHGHRAPVFRKTPGIRKPNTFGSFSFSFLSSEIICNQSMACLMKDIKALFRFISKTNFLEPCIFLKKGLQSLQEITRSLSTATAK